MTGPIHMNQVLYQTPTVEKIHQAEHHHPEVMQRQATAEEMAQLRVRTETVQQPVQPEHSRELDNQKREKGSAKKKRPKQNDLSAVDVSEEDYEQNNGPGGIVDIRI